MIMQVIVNESQYKRIYEGKHFNFKPSREFDRKYGTNLGQTYNFGKNLNSDDVWDLFQDCYDFDESCDKLRNLVLNLDESMFPYPGVKKLDISTKIDILQGMASELNFNDIVHFAIKKKTGMTDKSFDKFYRNLTRNQTEDLQWIASPKTLKTIKKIFK